MRVIMGAKDWLEDYADLRELSMRDVAKLLGRSPATVSRMWDEFPYSYRTEGGRGRVPVRGLRMWQEAHGKKNDQPGAGGAGGAS